MEKFIENKMTDFSKHLLLKDFCLLKYTMTQVHTIHNDSGTQINNDSGTHNTQ
jgi:hypothetical protein